MRDRGGTVLIDERAAREAVEGERGGERVRFVPAHIDPTMALHERAYLCAGDEIVDVWPIDLRGW